MIINNNTEAYQEVKTEPTYNPGNTPLGIYPENQKY